MWSGRQDLNLRHLAPKASALPDCATPRCETGLSTFYWWGLKDSNLCVLLGSWVTASRDQPLCQTPVMNSLALRPLFHRPGIYS